MTAMSLFPHFADPSRLWILLVIPVMLGVYVLLLRLRNRGGMRFTNTSMLGAVVKPQSQWRRHLAVALSLLSLITLTLAYAKPTGTLEVPRERATIVLVLDTSQSMQAKDVKPDRITVAKQAAQAFVRSLPEQYNVALVTMSGSASMVVAPTTDRTAVDTAIQTAPLRDSTAIGEAIIVALNALNAAPKGPNPNEPAPGAIVLLSDGGNTIGRPAEQGAAEAARAKRKVYTIAYGTENGYVDFEGKREPVPVNTDELKRVAQMTGGESFRAASPDQLKKVYANIGSSVGHEKAEREVTSRYAGFGFGFGVLAALCAISLAVRWP